MEQGFFRAVGPGLCLLALVGCGFQAVDSNDDFSTQDAVVHSLAAETKTVEDEKEPVLIDTENSADPVNPANPALDPTLSDPPAAPVQGPIQYVSSNVKMVYQPAQPKKYQANTNLHSSVQVNPDDSENQQEWNNNVSISVQAPQAEPELHISPEALEAIAAKSSISAKVCETCF